MFKRLVGLGILLTLILFDIWSYGFKLQDHAQTRRIPTPQSLYDADNETYFGGMLPHNVTVVLADPPDSKFYPGRYIVGETVHPPFSNSWTIYVSKTYTMTETDLEETVLHESCHVYMYQVRDASDREYTPEESHGDEWQACMLGLAKKGAFADIW